MKMPRGIDVAKDFDCSSGCLPHQSGQSFLRVLVALVVVAQSWSAEAKGPADYELFQQMKGFDDSFEAKPWSEVEHQLPSAPAPANLIPIEVGALTDNKFFVDEQSVSYGSDEVVRYTLVVTSPNGARNVSFEGMRCATAERRLYAFGRSDGSWSKARGNAWVRIQENNLNRQHAALFRDYFCSPGGSVMDTASARRVLPKGNPAALER